jgi:hypothetical protein
MMWKFFRRNLSTVFELVAFIAVAVLLAHLFGPWWALLPAAVYLFFLSWSLDRGK